MALVTMISVASVKRSIIVEFISGKIQTTLLAKELT